MSPGADWIRDVLWTALWQSSAWLVVGLAAAALLGRRPARAHGVLLLCMAGAAITPILSAALRLAGLGILPGISRSVDIAVLAAQLSGNDGVPVAAAGLTWIHAVAAAWPALSAVAIGRLAVSARRGRKLVAEASPIYDGRVAPLCRRAADRLGLGLAPSIWESDAVRCPVVWCWGTRPQLLLPAGGLDGDTDGLLGVLCHELAHFIRRDHLASLAAELALCIVPWNPLAWVANRRLRDLGEHACDSWVVATGASPTTYAETLLGLAPQETLVLMPAAAAGRRSVARRIRCILDARLHNPRRGRRWTVLAALATALLVAGSALAHRRPPTVEVVTETGLTAPLVGPDVITIPPELDLGLGVPGQPVSREVLLCNRSTVTHAVFGAATSCGCTSVSDFDPVSLSPGECMTVEVTMTAPVEPGTSKTKYVTFDIEGQAPLKLAVHLQATGKK